MGLSQYDGIVDSRGSNYVCRLCDTKMAKSGGTSNIKRHLMRQHAESLHLINMATKTPIAISPLNRLQRRKAVRIKREQHHQDQSHDYAGPSTSSAGNVGQVTMDGYIIFTAPDLCRFCVAWRENMRNLDDEEKRWLGPDDQWITCPICPRCARKIRKDRFEDFFARANEASELLAEVHRRFANASLPIDIQAAYAVSHADQMEEATEEVTVEDEVPTEETST